MQTNNTLSLSNKAFANKESKELRFSAKEKQFLTVNNPINFNRCVVSLTKDSAIALRQKKQGKKLAVATSKKLYIQQRARGAYIATIC
jgi:hypothetical protein